MNMEQHVNTLLTVYGEDLNRLRNRIGKDCSENTFRAVNMGRDYVERFLWERSGWPANNWRGGGVTRAYWRGDITWNPFAGFHIAKNIRPMEYRMMAKRILTIMQEIGVTKHITMHCARHSFAVLALTKGMPIESVSRILGHTNITTTQIYAKITIQKLNADMDNFEKQLADLSGVFSEFCHLLRYIW